MPAWIGGADALHGTGGAPDVNTATGVVDGSATLRVEPGWGKFRWVDARHLKGAGGAPGTSYAWSHPQQGPQPTLGRRLIGLTAVGWNTIWCDVTDAGGTRRYESRSFYITHHYEVTAPPTADLLADGGLGFLSWYPHRPQDPEGAVGEGLAMHVEIRPITVPGIASPPPMVAGPPIPGQTTYSFDAPAGPADSRVHLSYQYTKPSSVPPDGLVWGWEPVITFPKRPHIGEVRWLTVWHRYVTAAGIPPGMDLAVRTPFPVGHFLRSDPNKIPLADSADFAGAPTQAQAVARWTALIAAKPLWVDAGDAAGTPIYSAPDVPAIRTVDVKWENSQNVAGGSSIGNGQQIILGMPVPPGAIASAGTDRNYMVVAPNHLGGSEWSTWKTSQRYGNCEPYGYWQAGDVTPLTPQHDWWATAGGLTTGFNTNPSGVLAANHNASVSGITMWGMILTVDECQAAFAAYHPTNQAAWDTIIDHVVYMLSTQYRSSGLSWPARGTDGTSANAQDLMSGQRVSIHPDLNLTTLNWAGKKLGHIIARAIQRRGLIQADTCGGGGTNLGCQSGITYTMAAGTSPWSVMREGNPNQNHLAPIPTTFVHPTTSVVTQTWRVHRRLVNQADWTALNV